MVTTSGTGAGRKAWRGNLERAETHPGMQPAMMTSRERAKEQYLAFLPPFSLPQELPIGWNRLALPGTEQDEKGRE